MIALQDSGEIKGLKIGRRAPRINHLFFADGPLFFFKATPDSCSKLRTALDEFATLSGEVVSLENSFIIFFPNTPSTFVRFMRKPLGVKNRATLGTYLGCPMDIDGRSSSKFDFLYERMVKKTSSWKFNNLSQAGKLLLINSIIIALSSHVLATYMLPKKEPYDKPLHSVFLEFISR